jgi:hypothetical protein
MVRAMSGRSMVLLAPVCALDEDTLFAVVGVHVGAGPHHGACNEWKKHGLACSCVRFG